MGLFAKEKMIVTWFFVVQTEKPGRDLFYNRLMTAGGKKWTLLPSFFLAFNYTRLRIASLHSFLLIRDPFFGIACVLFYPTTILHRCICRKVTFKNVPRRLCGAEGAMTSIVQLVFHLCNVNTFKKWLICLLINFFFLDGSCSCSLTVLHDYGHGASLVQSRYAVTVRVQGSSSYRVGHFMD